MKSRFQEINHKNKCHHRLNLVLNLNSGKQHNLNFYYKAKKVFIMDGSSLVLLLSLW